MVIIARTGIALLEVAVVSNSRLQSTVTFSGHSSTGELSLPVT
jgi:hypothetical protein